MFLTDYHVHSDVSMDSSAPMWDMVEAEVAAAQRRLEEEYEAARHANNYQVKGPRSIKDAGVAVPRSVVKKNKAKREAAKAAEKARAKKK